jgi:hypothetical protein
MSSHRVTELPWNGTFVRPYPMDRWPAEIRMTPSCARSGPRMSMVANSANAFNPAAGDKSPAPPLLAFPTANSVFKERLGICQKIVAIRVTEDVTSIFRV